MWFGTMSRITPRPRARERAELLLAAEGVGDGRGSTTSYPCATRARLQRRRQIEVRDAEVAQVRARAPAPRAKAELGRQLQAIGGPESRARRQHERDASATCTIVARRRAPDRSHAQRPVASTTSQRVPNRRAGSRNVIGLEVRVEEQQERVVAHLLAGLRRLGVQLVAVQEDADRARLGRCPSRVCVIRRPSGRIHQTSGSCSPLPSKNLVRRKTGMRRGAARSAAA